MSLLVLLFWATPISPLLVAAILVAELLPLVLGAPLAGMLVDRLPNRRLLIIALLFQGVAIAAIAPLIGAAGLRGGAGVRIGLRPRGRRARHLRSRAAHRG
ncbi:hypothetical protein [Lentzea sp. E54]|uniref:hypothetical protein n=1 Tax=Lentzea xerophila TaxID=3435883 RepID=UPI003DA37594